ncbi:MAG: hypothetical protein IKX26_04805 [Bacteroidales bacterium]|nr:hypothetical protein [Bacteroidales bacterium]
MWDFFQICRLCVAKNSALFKKTLTLIETNVLLKMGWIKSFFRRKDCIAIILIVILVPFFTIHQIRLNKEMRDDSVLVKAEIVDMYYKNIGARRYKPGWEIRFKYELDGQVFSKSNTISEKQYNSINIGDTIEVLVSLKHPNRRAFWTGASGYLALPSQTELNSIPRKP